MMTVELPVTQVKGVGSALAVQLAALGIMSVADLFSYFPYRYENYAVRDLASVSDGEYATITGKIQSEPLFSYFAKKRSRLSVRVLAGRTLLTAIVFNRPYLKRSLQLGETVTLTGKWEKSRAALVVSEFHRGDHVQAETFLPVYPVREGLSVKKMRAVLRQALAQFGGQVEENLPSVLCQRYRLIGRKEAMTAIHFPANGQQLKEARRRLVYEELLIYELKMQVHQKSRKNAERGIAFSFDDDKIRPFIAALPFQLTAAQQRVLAQIFIDMRQPAAMNRLLQGDVGSGKTIIAAIVLFAAVKAGYQGALMVPTEILAQQHANALEQLMTPFSIRTALLTGSVRGKKRQVLLDELRTGGIDILIGTHALIQEGVDYHRLGLVITDEQHRFGVIQRRLLREKGNAPDVLYMTATPIPRTLALSVFGDMDISTIDELPGGRKAIKTYWVRHDLFPRVVAFIRKAVEAGRQVYVICPLIEESEQLDMQNALDMHSQLTQALTGIRIGLMHGRLSPEEKSDVMQAFAHNELPVLVSTTVIEVGVDVPNATLMIVNDADRFGLSQLHQLRGRVGRGSSQSYCILIAEAKSEGSREKMKWMTETTDGFKLAELDLKMRGPGDFFGKKQSGLPDFKLADLVHDFRTLVVARQDAAAMVANDAFWSDPDYRFLRAPLNLPGVADHNRLD